MKHYMYVSKVPTYNVGILPCMAAKFSVEYENKFL